MSKEPELNSGFFVVQEATPIENRQNLQRTENLNFRLRPFGSGPSPLRQVLSALNLSELSFGITTPTGHFVTASDFGLRASDLPVVPTTGDMQGRGSLVC